MFKLPYFIGAKIEAFRGRGNDDYLGSHDMEDIIAVIDGSTQFISLCRSSPPAILNYIRQFFTECLESSDFNSALEGHITDRMNSAARAQVVLGKIKAVLEP